MRTSLFLLANALAVNALALPQGKGDGRKGKGQGISRDEARDRADAVREAFQTAWDGYSQCVIS